MVLSNMYSSVTCHYRGLELQIIASIVFMVRGGIPIGILITILSMCLYTFAYIRALEADKHSLPNHDFREALDGTIQHSGSPSGQY